MCNDVEVLYENVGWHAFICGYSAICCFRSIHKRFYLFIHSIVRFIFRPEVIVIKQNIGLKIFQESSSLNIYLVCCITMCVSTCQVEFVLSRYTHGVTANQIYIDTSPCNASNPILSSLV